MGAFYLALDGLAEEGAFAAKEEQVFVLGVVQHLDGIPLEDVLQFVVLQDVIGFPAFLVDQPEAVNGVYLDPLGDVQSFLDNVLTHFLALVV